MEFVPRTLAASAVIAGGVAWIELFAPGATAAIGGLLLVNVGLLGLTWPLWG